MFRWIALALFAAAPLAAGSDRTTIDDALKHVRKDLEQKIAWLRKVNRSDLIKFMQENTPTTLKHLNDLRREAREADGGRRDEIETAMTEIMREVLRAYADHQDFEKHDKEKVATHLEMVRMRDRMLALELKLEQAERRGQHAQVRECREAMDELERKVRRLEERLWGNGEPRHEPEPHDPEHHERDDAIRKPIYINP